VDFNFPKNGMWFTAGGVLGILEERSVAAALSWCFAILVNKFHKIMKIFERLDHLRNRWVLCQH
jgi:hypothetical protein